MDVISLFSGCGGLDLGFKNAGFNVIWANEYDKSIWETYEKNHPETKLDKRNIKNIKSKQIPNCIGIIGGPPCQSWSNAGTGMGIKDPRGKLFYQFTRIIKDKQPLFFLAENVAGILSKRNSKAYKRIVKKFETAGKIGYNIYANLVDSNDYNVPQSRKRVIFIGYRKDLKLNFTLPLTPLKNCAVRDAIYDLKDSALPAKTFNSTNGDKCSIANHEYWTGGYSYIFMSRNRVLTWDKPSYTIQASGRQVSIHPKAPHMVKVEKDVMKFVDGKEHLYRRLTIRECARIQTFPDNFIFHYNSLENGYKMVGNAVPVELSKAFAEKIHLDITTYLEAKRDKIQAKQKKKDLCLPNTVLKRQRAVLA